MNKKFSQSLIGTLCLLSLGSLTLPEAAQAGAFSPNPVPPGQGGIFPGNVNLAFVGPIIFSNNYIDFLNSDFNPPLVADWDNTGDLVGGRHIGTVNMAESSKFGNPHVPDGLASGILAGEDGSTVDLTGVDALARDLGVPGFRFENGTVVDGPAVETDGLNWLKFDLNDNDIFGDVGDVTFSFTTYRYISEPSPTGFDLTIDVDGYMTFIKEDSYRAFEFGSPEWVAARQAGDLVEASIALFNATSEVEPENLAVFDSAAEFNAAGETPEEVANSSEINFTTVNGAISVQVIRLSGPPVPEPTTLFGAAFSLGLGMFLKKGRQKTA